MNRPITQDWLIFKSGERFPVLIGSDGKPLFYPNLYITTSKRSSNVAAKTLAQAERAIMFLMRWAEQEGFDIHQRFSKGQFFELHELESLGNAASRYLDDFYGTESKKKSERHVEQSSINIRLSYTRGYLDWLAKLHNNCSPPRSFRDT
jgi:hypothetical protein